MNREIRQTDQRKAAPILEFLEEWQQTTGQSGILLDSSLTFYTRDGALHRVDAGWVSHHQWKQQRSHRSKAALSLCPSFVVKFTAVEDEQFEQHHSEMMQLRDQGCQLGWLIDPKAEHVYVFQPGFPVHQVPTFDYYVSGRSVLQGFEFPLKCLRYWDC